MHIFLFNGLDRYQIHFFLSLTFLVLDVFSLKEVNFLLLVFFSST